MVGNQCVTAESKHEQPTENEHRKTNDQYVDDGTKKHKLKTFGDKFFVNYDLYNRESQICLESSCQAKLVKNNIGNVSVLGIHQHDEKGMKFIETVEAMLLKDQNKIPESLTVHWIRHYVTLKMRFLILDSGGSIQRPVYQDRSKIWKFEKKPSNWNKEVYFGSPNSGPNGGPNDKQLLGQANYLLSNPKFTFLK